MHYSNLAYSFFKKGIWTIIGLIHCFTLFSQSQTNTSTSLTKIEKIVTSEMDTINQFYGKHFNIEKTNSITEVVSDSTIELNFNNILQMGRLLDTSQLQWIIILTIAHEYAHLLQKESKFLAFYTSYAHRLFESQADILAGYYLTHRVREIYQQTKDTSLGLFNGKGILTARPFQSALKLFYELGVSTFSDADHPDKYKRAESISRGMFLFELDLFEIALLNIEKQDSPSLKSEADFIKLINADLYKLNLPDKHTFMTLTEFMNWSYEQAKLIVHGNTKNLVDIKIEDPKADIIHEVYPKMASFKFSTRIDNIGEDTLLFKYEVRIGKPLDDSSSKFDDNFLFSENRYHEFLLFPRKSMDIRDTFRTNIFESSVIYPPSKLSLYYCERKTKSRDFATPSTNYKLVDDESLINLRSISAEDWEIEFDNYIELIIDAINRNDFSYIIAGLGKSSYAKKTLEYNGIIPKHSNFTCKIIRHLTDKTKSGITIVLGKFDNERDSDSVFNQYVALLNKIFHNSLLNTFGTKTETAWYTLNNTINIKESEQFVLEDSDNLLRREVSNAKIKTVEIHISKK